MKIIYHKSWGLLCVVLLLLASPNPILLSQTPTWSVTPSDYSNTMTITAELNINCIKSTDTNDLVGIFDAAGNCRGVENVVEQGGDFYVFLTAYSNESSGETLHLKMYDASADVVYDAVETVEFVSNAILGTGSNPYDIRNNRPPTDINLNSSAIEENQPIGTVVGTFSTADEDDGETFTYSLVSGTGDNDNASFSIDGEDLKSAEIFDLETKDTYLIRVQTTDAGNCSYEEAFTIIINDGNDAPTDMALSNTEVAENEVIGTFIGSLTSTDTDVGNTYTYSLVPGTGDDDNGSFSIENENLVTAEVFDFEVKSSYSIRLQTDDNNGGTFQKQFTITITDVNDVPTAMALDNDQIAENEDAGTLIANLSSTDQDAADTHTYSLVNGAGDVDNANFSILNGDELVSNESFNFEAKDSYTIRLQTDDGNGGTYQESFNITITDANDAPTDIDLSSYDTEENAPVNTLVAAFSTTDEDSGDSFTYSLVAGLGDTDNGSFQIVNGQLFTDEVFDFETKNTYSIRVQTDDSNGGVYEEVVAIDINDTNDAPTDIALSQLTINENEPALTVLASLTTTDEDATDSHTYSLVSGDGDDDNSSFIVQDGEILTASSFNFELQSIYSIRLQTTDKGNQTHQKNFTIEVQDINDVPTALILSSLEVEENQAEGTIVGTFGTADEDLADIHTYSFVSIQPNDHNAFYILDNTLRTNEVFDYETDSSYIVYVETNDGNGGTLMETFFIKIVDGNDAPTALLMNSTTVDENQNIGTTVSTLSSTDLDQNDTFTYTLVNGVGSENNDQFSINGNQLQTAEVFNFEAKNSYLIRLRTTDSEGGFYEQAYTIHINNTNDAPTDLFLDNIYISENQPAATVVGNLSSTDEDTGDSYIYSLVSGIGSSDNASFSIVGGLLLTNESFDFETKDTYNIRIRTQDNGGGSYEEEIIIHITNANESPFELTINNTNIAENEDFASFVGIFNTIDPDIFDTHFYSFADLTPNNNGSFVIVEDQLRTFEVFDFETQNVYVVHVETNDGNGGTFVQQFVINVTDANDAPTAIALSSNTIAENLPSGSTVGFFQTTDQDAGDTFTYSLVEGFGGEDNASFQISDNELQSAETFDLDTKGSYSILVRTEDGNGDSFEQIFTILITDANDAPTDLALSTPFIKENNEVNSIVGTFTTTDADAADTFTYSLVEGEGSDDNGSFSITSNQLLAMESFNFEVQNVYSIRVQSDDGNGGTIEKIFAIDIQNANDAPTDLQLDNASVAENQPVNTLIGVFSSTDEDTGEIFTYSFDNEETNDNGSFVIVGNELRTFASFNFEAADTYNIQVKTTDSGGKTYTEPFLIEITDANDAPTDIQLSSNTIAENLSIGSKVGVFSTTDEDTNDSFSYSLAAGIGDDDNASFQISGDELQSNEVFDLDVKDSYQIRIQTNDGNGGTYQETFTINITDSNDAPTAISMSNQSIEENQPIGTIVGSFDTADTDANDEFSYTLVAGNGDSDNGSFEISGNELFSKETFNFEVKNSYSIRVQTDDGNGGTFEETFAIQILDTNDTPISLSLNNNLIAENLSPNTPIGTLTTVDEDAANSFVYTFDNNLSNDNDLFSIVGNEVRTNTIFNFEENNSFNIAIQTNDGQGGTLSQQFTIQITNANDTPTDIQLSSNTIAENLSIGSKVGIFSTTDEDASDSFTYSLVAGIGADDNGSFQISGSELQSAEMFDLDVKDTYSIRIQTNDGNGGTFEETFTINITDANDAPTALSMNNQSIEENQATGSLVGSFNTTDADANDNFSYTLVDGNGSDDNSSFQIAGEELLTLAKFNFEVKNSYSIRVQTDDGNGGTLEEIFTINITDINDVPTLVNLNNNLIAENLSPNTSIGTLTTVDEDAANSFVYTFDNNLSNDNDLFSIVGNEVRTNTIFNFEENNSFNIAIQTNDGQGGTLSQQFTIQITNANDTPTDIQLSSNTIAENLSSGSKVGSFSTTDEDANDSFTYSLVAGIGADDNASFQISGSELQSAEMFDLDVKDTYSIRIQTNDGNGGTFEETFTINITDANDAPTALSMNNQNVEENQVTGSLVGSFSTTDADENDNFSYTLVDGDGSDDNSSFQIAGEELLTLAKFNFEVKNSYSIRVQTDDGNGGTLEEIFTINITDINDVPTLINLNNNLIAENLSPNTPIGTLTTVDEDVANSFVYTFDNNLSNDNDLFSIVGNEVRTNTIFNFEENNSFNIAIQTNDGQGGTLSQQFTIQITNANDTPTDIQLSSNTIAENLNSGSKVGVFNTTDEDVNDSFTYSLVAGIGADDNASFQISGSELQSAEMFDLDVKDTYSIRIQTNDGNGGTFEETFTINITDANDAPTALSMNNQNVEENQATGSLVGSFSTTDADENDNFSYTLVDGDGSDDNSSFQIAGEELLTLAKFNFEVKNSYSIRVQTDDGNGGTLEETFVISIEDANDLPTLLELSNNLVSENQPQNTEIGTFATTDEDTNSTFTYTFQNEGVNDNAQFLIIGNSLRTNAHFNFEEDNVYVVNIQVNDGNGGILDNLFVINITDSNDAPTDIQLSSHTIAENLSSGSKVGNFSATDEDLTDGFTYSLVAGIGDVDNSSFQITGNELQSAEMFDLDSQSSYQIRVRVTDNGGSSYEEIFSIQITDSNDAPTALSMDSQHIEENKAIASLVGSFNTIDSDENDNFTYTLVAGSGDTDNSSFQIVEDELLTAATFNFEVKNNYSIRVQTDDGNGGTFEENFVIQILDSNDLPTAINMDNLLIAENQPFNTLIGELSTTDEDTNNNFTYSFDNSVSNDNTLFAIVGNQVLTNAAFNFEVKNSYHIGIQTNDGNGGTHSQQFTINITDANDAPTALQLSSSTIAENLEAGSKVGILMTTDEDANANFTYSLVEGIGSDDNSSFKIVGSELQSAEMFDLDTKASYSIRVQTNDGQGGIYEETFTIKITDTNDAPTALTLNKQSVSENQPIETLVGTFSTEDADEADNFTYKLVAGDNDNGSFVIQNNELRTQQVFNFEVKNAYTIEVQTDDGNGGVLTMSFFINITDANDTPTALSLDNNVVAENEEANTLVGTFTTTDEDENNEFVYTFVNEQDNDNKNFFLVGNELRTTTPFNFEEKAFYQVYIQSSDGLGGTMVRPFMVSVSNANDAPTDLQLSSNTIAENLASNSNIGFFTTSDEDANETFSYELVNGNGSQGNAAFQIIGNELISSVSFDLDAQDSYSIRVRSADAKGGSFEKVFNILITDANDAPTALSLNNLTILENQEIGTLVGTLSTQDADNNDSFTYKLVTGQGDSDNSFFKINNGELLSATTFNYETQSQFAIRIQTNDGNGGTFEQTFNIKVINQNDLPTAMSLSNNLVVENQAQGTIIGFFETSDEDVSDTFSYTFVAGTSYNHEAFVIVDNVLMTNYPLNFESQTLYNIQVQSNDGNGGTFTRQFTINVANANDEPTDISLSSNTIAENLPSESIVGYFNAEDEDAGTNFMYSLVNGDGSTDNASFKIVGNELRSAVSFDLDTKATYTIRVQVSDGQGGTKEEIFSVQITDANDAPTALLLSNFDIIENHPIGTVIGVLSSTDADAFDSFTYKLVAGTGGNDNQFFTINDNQLVSNSVFNYEEKNSFHVRIRTDDGNGGFLDKTFVINVLNENDLPTAMQLSQSSLAENEAAGTLIGTLTTTDEDSDAAFTYTLTNNSTDNSYFLIEGNELRSKGTFNFEEQAFYQIAIEVNDGNGGTLIREWVISITNENDVPNDLLLTSNTIAENLSSNTTVGLLETQDEDAGESFTYSLVTGAGSEDNAHFKILGNELKSNAVFDLDAKDNYTVRIQSTDSQGASIVEVFNIIITDANDAPTALTMNVQQIAENQEVGTLVAQLSTQDADAFDTFTYKLVSGQGSTDNSNFKVVGDELVSNTVFNFEAKSQYQIRLETNDGNGGTFQQSFNIQVTDANDAPTALKLSNSVVAENQDAGTLVGVFTTTDEDANDIFSYKFINSSENDNAYFTLDGNVLKTSTPLDFEEQAFHTIEVQTDDGNSGTFALQLSITVTNNNDDVPTAISLTRNSVAENQVVGTLVGKLSTQDIDGNSNFTYSFAPGGANNEQFVIDGDILLTNAVFNYEVKNSYQIRLQTDDGNEGVFQENFTIFITDENDQPTDIALSNNKVTEEQASGTTVGILSSTDEDANDSFTYTLVDEGANDNESFVIQGAVLQTNKKLDYETQPFLTVAVQTDDGQGGNFVKQLTIEVVDSNEDAPTAISITRNSVPENQVIGTLVGKFNTQDIDGGGNFVYTLAAGVADNDLFAIEADALLTRAVFNYEVKNAYQILVRTEDENGNSFEEGMTILITDENDAPSAISLSSNELIENQLEGALIGYFSTADEDANDSYSYRFVDLQNNDNDLFSIVGGELRSNALFNFEAKQSYSIDIETDDNRGGTHQQSFQILIIDNNDVPTGLSLSNQSIAENQPIGTIVGMLNTIDEDAIDSHTYILVPGLGGEDNDLFSIVGNELVSNAVFDLEVQAELKVRILTTDAAGTSFDTPFIITVRDENDAPTLLSLSSQTIAENQAIGTVVGTFNTTDPDGGDEHSYELIEGVGGDHNDLFSIQDNVLFSSAVFDFEVQNNFSILVKSSDGQADGIQQAFTVTILDANDAPAAIALSPASVPENEAIGTYVGTLSAMDQDVADSHQFELVNSGSGNNNDHFSIVNNELRTFKVLDFEAQPTYFIEVMADDMRGGTLTQVLSVEVTDANDAPTALVLTNQQVVENAAIGSTIGMFMTTDIDAADSHIYSLIEGMGSQDNAAFGIEGANLVLNTDLDINTKDTYSIRVAATDLGGKAISQSFQIQVIDANNSPTAILLSNLSIRENEASGTIIGSLLAEDADVDDEHTFELVTNDNAPHSEWFKIVDGQLMSAITFNYELNPSLQIAVVTTDLQGSTFEQAFTIEVVNVNESPMILSESFSIAENLDESSTVGTIEATDEDSGQTLTFALVNESDVPFKLDASTGELTLATSRLDYEEQASYSLEIEVSDNGSPVLSASKTIEVRIEDLIETTQTLPANNYLSPNNDGSNDYFEIQNVELYADFELTIFNANGEEIFHQVGNYQNDWDGTFDGEILPTGVYYYLFQNPNDSEEVFKGTISIVK